MNDTQNVTDQGGSDSVEVAEEWRDFNSDPTPFLTFSKQVDTEIAGEAFSVFIRLPNPFQHRKVQQHAQAARARRVMAHKDPESDIYAITAEKLEQFLEMDEDKLRDWLLDRHSSEAIFAAQIELEFHEEEGADGSKKRMWEDIPQHQERYAIMLERNETEVEEFENVEKILTSYAEALQEKANEYLEPYRAHYDALDRQDLEEKVRRALIKADCLDEFTNVYNLWQIYYGARKSDNHNTTYFSNINELLDAEGPVIELLTEEFSKLDALKAGELKKSPRAISLLASLAQSEI